MKRAPRTPVALPHDAASIRELAVNSMFDLFSSISEGMMLVDRAGRVVWINEGYKRFLPALGFKGAEEFVGRPVEEVVPNTL
ncbi:MAG TPA: PAS domain-containing protein, partial [Burkholderiales bacterium]|nr:PAS domain-containing protein [Burkholderiales bacterium]